MKSPGRLQITEIRRPPEANEYVWIPFPSNEEFNDRWWGDPPDLVKSPLYVQVLRDNAEVARVELDDTFRGSRHIGAPKLGTQALEIQFLEVAKSCRRQGIGMQVVAHLAAAYPDRRLLALSEGADEFWASLGWDRYDYANGGLPLRPLFVQPG